MTESNTYTIVKWLAVSKFQRLILPRTPNNTSLIPELKDGHFFSNTGPFVLRTSEVEVSRDLFNKQPPQVQLSSEEKQTPSHMASRRLVANLISSLSALKDCLGAQVVRAPTHLPCGTPLFDALSPHVHNIILISHKLTTDCCYKLSRLNPKCLGSELSPTSDTRVFPST